MEQYIVFNGVRILLTTGQTLREIQNYTDRETDLILSVYQNDIRVLRGDIANPEAIGRAGQ